MKYALKLSLALIALAVCLVPVSRADIVKLKNGKKVQGDILKDDEEFLVVDIGVDIIKIPQKDVESRVAEENEDAVEEEQEDGIYARKEMNESSIKDKVDTFGEGVVLVSRVSGGLGSGFIISDEGHVITNYHVVEGETKLTVTLFLKTDGEFEKRKLKKIKIVALSPVRDIALLKLDKEELGDVKLTKCFLGELERLKVGETVFAVGNPHGLERSVSQGIVSSKTRTFGGLLFIQTTAPINPGNSGGPVFNLRGEIIGIACAGFNFSDGLGLAIPVDELTYFLENHDGFAYDKDNPNAGNEYLEPPKRKKKENPPPLPE